MIAISGPAGSGKSTLANKLAARLLKPHVDLDDVTIPLLHAARVKDDSAPEAVLLSELRIERYQQLAQATRLALIEHGTCITSAPFTTHLQQPLIWSSWLDEVAVPFHSTVVWLDLNSEDRLARMRKRASVRDAALVASAGVLPPASTPVVKHIRVDARASLNAQVEHVLGFAL